MQTSGLLVLVITTLGSIRANDTSHPDSKSGCVIDLHCEECLPEYMPLVRSPPVRNGTVIVADKAVAKLWCGAGYFVQYPQTAEVSVTCDAGAWRVSSEGTARRLHELGCQESVFEDVLHEVAECSAPLQGRAWGVAGGSHLALACFDPERAVAVRVQLTPAHDKHRDRSLPLSLLGNFQHMFDARTRHDAERLYGDNDMLNRRAKARLAHINPNLASQTLVATPVVHSTYLKDEHTPVVRMASNLVASWRSVAEGNLRAMQADVATALRSATLQAWAGTSGEWRWRGAEPLRLGSAGRFPVPRFHWTVLLEPSSGKALALVVLNDPFVSVSDIREAVFCESLCSRVSWLNELLKDRAYETPLYGLAFCCEVHEFASRVPEMPSKLLSRVPRTKGNLLLNIADHNNLV